MTLMRWDPWRELETMRRSLDRFFQDDAWMEDRSPQRISLDIADAGERLLVKASLPGVDPEDVNISVSGRTLTIDAESKGEQERKTEHYVVRERHYGAMSRSVMLPVDVDADKAAAEYKNGVLTLSLPKTAAQRSRKIAVQKVS